MAILFKQSLITVTSKHISIINFNTNQIFRYIEKDESSNSSSNKWQEIKLPTNNDKDFILSISGESHNSN